MQPWFATLIKYKDRTRTCIEADIKTSLQEQNLFIQCRITVFWLVSSSKRFKRIATEGGIRLKKNLAIIQESSITCIRSNCNLHISCPDINLLLPTMESLFIHCAIMPFSKRCYFIAGGIGARSKKIRKASGIYFYKILQKFQKFSLLLFLFPPFLSLIDSSKKKITSDRGGERRLKRHVTKIPILPFKCTSISLCIIALYVCSRFYFHSNNVSFLEILLKEI